MKTRSELSSNCLQGVFGVTVTMLKITTEDRTSAETLQDIIDQTVDMIDPCGDEDERSLIIITNIGKAAVDDGHILFSTRTFRQDIFWDIVREALFADSEKLNHVRALEPIDCRSIPEITVQTLRKCQISHARVQPPRRSHGGLQMLHVFYNSRDQHEQLSALCLRRCSVKARIPVAMFWNSSCVRLVVKKNLSLCCSNNSW